MWDTYTWIFAMGIVTALFMAWGIGANDVANAFGTSVGAKALTLRQAILVAAVCEFGGAVLLGAGVTDTIKGGIARPSYFTYTPELLMYGMLCALAAASIWLALATFLELPVSTTHSISGAVVGFALVAGGSDAVVWTSPPTSSSPFPGGFVAIVLAWFITPTMAAVVAALLFTFTKFFVLYAKNPYKRSLMLFPIYTFITIWIVTFFVIQKGVNSWMKNKTYNNDCPPGGSQGKYKTASDGSVTVTGCLISDGTNAWISAVTAAVCTVLSIIALKWVNKLVERDMRIAAQEDEALAALGAAHDAAKAEGGDVKATDSPASSTIDGTDAAETAAAAPKPNRTPAALQDMRKSRMWNALTHGASVNIHECTVTDAKIKDLHGSAEVFDRKSEFCFKYLQVCTACANSFSHGANDVANSIGPLAAIYAVWQCECAQSKSEVPIWMFVIGGVGLVIGLATYGYNIMRALGVKVTKITNSRGYCAELTAAVIVIVASRYGFPVSTTQVITGAITGIGAAESLNAWITKQPRAGSRMNWLILLKFFAGWVATLIVAGLTSAAFMAQGVYSPSKPLVDDRAAFNKAFNTTNYQMGTTLNGTSDSAAQTCGKGLISAAKSLTLNSTAVLDSFQTGTWCLGNATEAGLLTDAYQPTMPLSSL